MFMNHDIRFQGSAPIEWPSAIDHIFDIDSLNIFLSKIMTRERSEVVFRDGSPAIYAGAIFSYDDHTFLLHFHTLIDTFAVTIHLLNEGDERLLTDQHVCREARRLRVLILSPISSEKLMEACDLLITSYVHEM